MKSPRAKLPVRNLEPGADVDQHHLLLRPDLQVHPTAGRDVQRRALVGVENVRVEAVLGRVARTTRKQRAHGLHQVLVQVLPGPAAGHQHARPLGPPQQRV